MSTINLHRVDFSGGAIPSVTHATYIEMGVTATLESIRADTTERLVAVRIKGQTFLVPMERVAVMTPAETKKKGDA